MQKIMKRGYIAAVILVAIAKTHADVPNYDDHIKPLFRNHCLKCHNSDEANADLDLSSFAAATKGGSSGPVVKAGRPESSQLYRAMAHLEGAEAMPPESPRLSEEKLTLVRNWIRGGLIAGKGGKSQLRSVGAMVSSVSAGTVSPLPKNWPPVSIAVTARPPVPQALAASPGATLFAASGCEQILLYGETQISSADTVTPVAAESLIRRWSFEEQQPGQNIAAKFGQTGMGIRINANSDPVAVSPIVAFDLLSGLTISAWVRPQPIGTSQTIFGQPEGFRFWLERHKNGWRPRIYVRNQDNGISYFGRVGFVADNEWSHVAATWNGKQFNWYVNGQRIAEQGCPPELQRIQQRENQLQTLGFNGNKKQSPTEPFRGDLDELRIYDRALSDAELSDMPGEHSGSYDCIGTLQFPEGTIHDLKFSRNGSILLAAGGRGAHSGNVVLYDVASGKRLGKIGDEADSVLAADISADHNFVALGGPGKLVKLFDTKTGNLLHRIQKHTDWITALSFSPDGSLLATGDRSGGIHLWETEKGAIVFTLDEHKVRITSLSWRADGELLASTADDGNLILWDMKDGFPIRNTVAHAGKSNSRYTRGTGALAMQYAADGRLLTAGRDGTARIWSGEGDQQLELPIVEGLPVSATWLSNGATAIIGSFDGSLHVWDTAAKASVQTLVNGDKKWTRKP